MKEFIEKHTGELFRYWIKKEMWTPYEMDIKDKSQLEYYSDDAEYGYFTNAFDLGCGDWLIEVTVPEWETSNNTVIKHYYRLKTMDFSLISGDQEIQQKIS